MAKIIQKENTKVVANTNPELIISQNSNSHSYSFSPAATKKSPLQAPKQLPNTTTYQYVQKEIQKTSIITISIISVSLMLYALIQLRAINVSIFGY
ncbi:MAG: hypothetical protein KA035_02530 [Candidatus Levybacteria bacterium]|nr:hypothetical protein [Candidatus Levybacteria bacterium]